jgi:hypothetical protein
VCHCGSTRNDPRVCCGVIGTVPASDALRDQCVKPSLIFAQVARRCGERSRPVKANAIVMLLAMTVHAKAFIASSDCQFGQGSSDAQRQWCRHRTQALGSFTWSRYSIPSATGNGWRSASRRFAPTNSESCATSMRTRAANTGERNKRVSRCRHTAFRRGGNPRNTFIENEMLIAKLVEDLVRELGTRSRG